MLFPIHDRYWVETSDFVQTHIMNGEKLIAPVEFEEKFSKRAYSYSSGFINNSDFQWAIIHKGMINEINHALLKFVTKDFRPVFANEVFVVYSSRRELAEVDRSSPHYISFEKNMNSQKSFKKTLLCTISTVKRQIIHAGLSNKEKIKRIPFLNNIAKRIYYKMLFSDPIAMPYHQTNSREHSSLITHPTQQLSNRDLIYLGDYRALTRTVFGQKIFVDTRDISIAPHILLDGYWEMWITKVFMDTIKEGMTVIEVGSNIGYYTLLAASQIGANGRLYAFEANSHVFEILFQNMAVNGFLDRATLINKAVSDKSEKLKFHKLKRYHGSSSIVELSQEFLNQYMDEIETIEVEATSLDEYFAAKDTRIDIIKIDAEGSEALIFKGMGRILESNPDVKIICEFAPGLISGTGKDPKDFLEEIISYGFKLKIIGTDSNLVDISMGELLAIHHCELFLMR